MSNTHPIEKLIATLTYKGVSFELVERPDVLWVGCVDYASNNTDESDIGATLKRFQALVQEAPIQHRINPDWSAALSINYTTSEKPCGIMFANECHAGEQDPRYDIVTQSGGLWLRVRNDKTAAKLLFDKESAEPWQFFAGNTAPLQSAALENGYIQNMEIAMQIEYHCHAEYSQPEHSNYAYIPVIKQ